MVKCFSVPENSCRKLEVFLLKNLRGRNRNALILTVLMSDILIYSQKLLTLLSKLMYNPQQKVILSSCCCDVDVKKFGILQNLIR